MSPLTNLSLRRTQMDNPLISESASRNTLFLAEGKAHTLSNTLLNRSHSLWHIRASKIQRCLGAAGGAVLGRRGLAAFAYGLGTVTAFGFLNGSAATEKDVFGLLGVCGGDLRLRASRASTHDAREGAWYSAPTLEHLRVFGAGAAD